MTLEPEQVSVCIDRPVMLVTVHRNMILQKEKEQQSEQHEHTVQKLLAKHETDMSHLHQEHALSAAKVHIDTTLCSLLQNKTKFSCVLFLFLTNFLQFCRPLRWWRTLRKLLLSSNSSSLTVNIEDTNKSGYGFGGGTGHASFLFVSVLMPAVKVVKVTMGLSFVWCVTVLPLSHSIFSTPLSFRIKS